MRCFLRVFHLPDPYAVLRVSTPKEPNDFGDGTEGGEGPGPGGGVVRETETPTLPTCKFWDSSLAGATHCLLGPGEPRPLLLSSCQSWREGLRASLVPFCSGPSASGSLTSPRSHQEQVLLSTHGGSRWVWACPGFQGTPPSPPRVTVATTFPVSTSAEPFPFLSCLPADGFWVSLKLQMQPIKLIDCLSL